MHAEPRRVGIRIERALLATGIFCLVWWGVASLNASLYQHKQRAVLEQTRGAAYPANSRFEVLNTSSLVGSIDIPRLGLSAVIAEGDDEATLKVAVGHLPDTPLPGDAGNSALAAHRDTFFRPLQHIRVGDQVQISTPRGDFHYQVRETMVVGPDDVWVLDPTDRPMLTLITCYPFNYVGKAPRRFIVRAERPISGNPEVKTGG
jgi:sortase A